MVNASLDDLVDPIERNSKEGNKGPSTLENQEGENLESLMDGENIETLLNGDNSEDKKESSDS